MQWCAIASRTADAPLRDVVDWLMSWKSESYEVATSKGPRRVAGITQAGLGVHLVRDHIVFKQPPLYAVTHLGSGHTIMMIEAHKPRTGQIVAELLTAGDWDFGGLKGWENMSPDLADKVKAIVERHGDVVRAGVSDPDDRQARTIARSRA